MFYNFVVETAVYTLSFTFLSKDINENYGRTEKKLLQFRFGILSFFYLSYLFRIENFASPPSLSSYGLFKFPDFSSIIVIHFDYFLQDNPILIVIIHY